VNEKGTGDAPLKSSDKGFTMEGTLGLWRKVSFVPFTIDITKDKKVAAS
jgi:hypothetical protein